MDPLKPIVSPAEPAAEAAFAEDAGPTREGAGPGAFLVGNSAAGDDPDFELLGCYLDGELTAAEAYRVEQRLSAEPELSASLGRMSAEYALRQAAFRSLEPDDRAADVLSSKTSRSVRRIERAGSGWQLRQRSLRLGRLAGAVAACVAISFCAGWVGRGYAAQGKMESAQTTPSPKDSAGEPSVYQVALTDERGNITAVQKFDKLEEAQAFAADVGRWQARQLQTRQGVPVAPTSSGL